MRDIKWRLLQMLVERLPPFISYYESAHRQYVADFFQVLQHVGVNNLSTRKQFLEAASEYLENYYGPGHPEYNTLPFLWFTCTFLRLATAALDVEDNFRLYLKLCYAVLRGAKGTTGVFIFLKQGLGLNDDAWEKLQMRAYEHQRGLDAEELAVVRLLFRVLPELQYSRLSVPNLQQLLNQHGAAPKLIRGIANFL